MNDDNCIFCRILRGEITTKILMESPYAIVIDDQNPIAPNHVLVISKTHHDDLSMAYEKNTEAAIHSMLLLAYRYTVKRLTNGYRIVINSGADAGQTVRHLHMHVLGGAKLKDL